MTPEYLKEILSYNSETGVIRWAKKINRRVVVGEIAGSSNGKCIHIMINYVNYKAHIIAWVLYYGVWPLFEIDHKDTNGEHNWITNLREATRSQNMMNTNPRLNTQSVFKGVTKSKDKWLARITVNNKRIRLGLFISKEEAAAAYAKAAKHYFGEFSRTGYDGASTYNTSADNQTIKQLDKLILGL